MKQHCFFRWRKIQSLGLAPAYNDVSSSVGKWLQYCLGLTYLEEDEVCDAFCELMSIMPENQRLTRFADYLTETYIDITTAPFPPSIWAAKSTALWRTTNACEGFHSKFNGSFETHHPNIFLFVKAIKNVQTETYFRMNTDPAQVKIKTDKKTREKRDFIDRKIDQLNTSQIGLIDFLKCVSYKATALKRNRKK